MLRCGVFNKIYDSSEKRHIPGTCPYCLKAAAAKKQSAQGPAPVVKESVPALTGTAPVVADAPIAR